MPFPSSAKNWWRLPGRLALLMGFGALSATSAEACLTRDAADLRGLATGSAAPQPGGSVTHSGSVLRIRGGAIEIAEGGGAFRDLRLGNTTEARHLKQLLQNNSAARGEGGTWLEPTILAGSGGSGFHWSPVPADSHDVAPPARSDDPSHPRLPASEKDASPETPKPNPNPTTNKG
jgi:hypothetical protein